MFKTVRVTPVGKPRMTQRDKWQKRPCVMRYRAFCDEVRLHTGGYLEGIHTVKLLFHIPMPKSWSKKKKEEMFNTPHRQKPDIDNLCKAFMDAILKDDSCVDRLEARKVWYTEGLIIYQLKGEYETN